MMPVTMQRHDAPSRSGVTMSRHIAASRSYGRTDGLTETGGFRDEKISRYVTRTRAERISRFVTVALVALSVGCSATPATPVLSTSAACTRFRTAADRADAPAATEAAMRRELAAMAAIPAPPSLAPLFREAVADDLAILNGTKGTIPGLLAVIRKLNAACGTAWRKEAS